MKIIRDALIIAWINGWIAATRGWIWVVASSVSPVSFLIILAIYGGLDGLKWGLVGGFIWTIASNGISLIGDATYYRLGIKYQSMVEKFGGRAVVQRVEPQPHSYITHIKGFYDNLAEINPDVVISEGVDVEFLMYGSKARDINLYELGELRRLGIAAFINVDRDWGLRHLSDVVILPRRGEAVIYSPNGRRTCRYEQDPAPRLMC